MANNTIVDFVLLHNNSEHTTTFLEHLKSHGISSVSETYGDTSYVKLCCSFDALCKQAEEIKLEMPLAQGESGDESVTCETITKFIEDYLVTDNEVDYVSAPFIRKHMEHFKDHDNKDIFFRRSLRSLLVYHILSKIDVDIENNDEEAQSCLAVNGKGFKKTKGLQYFLMKNIFTDSLVLHEETLVDHGYCCVCNYFSATSSEEDMSEVDKLINTWTSWRNFYKFQPLWKIRNYFGEKIAFYFAWTGMLVTSLWIPTILGLIVFLYGLGVRFRSDNIHIFSDIPTNGTFGLKSKILELMRLIHLTFDNDLTPFFAMVVCIWGTVFLEIWKRKSATLAYEWDVNDFQASEPDRPEFVGTSYKDHPVGEGQLWYYPLKRQFGKYLISMVAALVMMGIVVASLIGVIVYRIIMDIDVCPGITGEECLMLKTVTSSILNAISITILGRVYYHIAVWLTDKENHKTRSKYDDALIIKLFAFQFANSYSSCFYIAFFIERVDTSILTGRGDGYHDSCDGQSCMSQLTFQIIALMVIKPLPKFFKDVLWPLIKRSSICGSRSKCCSSQISDDHSGCGDVALLRELRKHELGDFTLGEYTEKVIQYGYLVLFAASFPLAPLFALVTNLIDIRVDGWRMLKLYRRPIAFLAQDIGMWYNILTFINYCGALSNAFLVAFTSSWGQHYDLVGKLIIVIGFEHIVFILIYLLAYLIPDVPVDVQEAIRKERYETQKIFQGETTVTGSAYDGRSAKIDLETGPTGPVSKAIFAPRSS